MGRNNLIMSSSSSSSSTSSSTSSEEKVSHINICVEKEVLNAFLDVVKENDMLVEVKEHRKLSNEEKDGFLSCVSHGCSNKKKVYISISSKDGKNLIPVYEYFKLSCIEIKTDDDDF